jgi:membrane associated rhomboid family serine protease
MEEEFPIITFTFSILIIASFIFTTNFSERIFNPEAESRLEYYERLFGFIPARPKIYSLLTYTFIHVDFWHLFGNLIFLVIAGLTLEKHIGKIPFLSIYISSGCIAATFDIINRLLLGIPMQAPFVGASGSIFGLIAIASLTRPMEKIPTVLVLLTFIPFIQLFLGLPIFADEMTLMTLIFLLLPFVFAAVFVLPGQLPFFLATILFIVSWILFLIFHLPVSASHIGHLGGLLGGFAGMLLFPREKP